MYMIINHRDTLQADFQGKQAEVEDEEELCFIINIYIYYTYSNYFALDGPSCLLNFAVG